MIIVMYHYIRYASSEYSDFNFLDVDVFRRQLDYFEKKYGFIDKEEFFDTVKKGKNIDGVVLTFDDGLKDHYTHVMPELQKRNLWGLFYVPTNYYTSNENKLLNVHRIHYLKGKYGATKILRETKKYIDRVMLDDEKIHEFDKEIYSFKEYEENEKELKKLFNYYIKYEYIDAILNKLMDKYFDEEKLCKEVYLSEQEIIELEQVGNVVGSHSASHKVLSRLSYDGQLKEIRDSVNFIKSITDYKYSSFCYPYGYKSSYDENTLKILDDLNMDNAVIFDNKILDGSISNYELSRIDCINFLKV